MDLFERLASDLYAVYMALISDMLAWSSERPPCPEWGELPHAGKRLWLSVVHRALQLTHGSSTAAYLDGDVADAGENPPDTAVFADEARRVRLLDTWRRLSGRSGIK